MLGLLRPLIISGLKKYMPIVTFPLVFVIAVVGYNLENLVSDKYTPSIKSVKEEREERLLKEGQETDTLKEKKFVPKTIFERNLSPSLLVDDTRGEKQQSKQ